MEHSGWGWAQAAVTKAWSYRLGARAQWLGSSGSALVYNDRGPGCALNGSSDELCAVVLDVDSAGCGDAPRWKATRAACRPAATRPKHAAATGGVCSPAVSSKRAGRRF